MTITEKRKRVKDIKDFLKSQGITVTTHEDSIELDTKHDNTSIDFELTDLPHCCGFQELGGLIIYDNADVSRECFVLAIALWALEEIDTNYIAKPTIFVCNNTDDTRMFAEGLVNSGLFEIMTITQNPNSSSRLTSYVSLHTTPKARAVKAPKKPARRAVPKKAVRRKYSLAKQTF